MAVVRMTLQEALSRTLTMDHARIAATTEEEIRRHMIEDGEDPDAEIPMDRVVIPPAGIRRKLGMSEEAFAAAIHVPLELLRDWEAGRVWPDAPARALLLILAREPEAALRALAWVPA